MNYTELMNRIEELKSRKGRGSISADETFSLLMELAEKTKAVDINAGSLTVRRVYISVAAMNADSNPVDQETGKPLKFGQLVCVCNAGDLTQADNGKIYRYNKPGWELLRQVGDMVQFAKTEDIDVKIAQIEHEISDVNITYQYGANAFYAYCENNYNKGFNPSGNIITYQNWYLSQKIFWNDKKKLLCSHYRASVQYDRGGNVLAVNYPASGQLNYLIDKISGASYVIVMTEMSNKNSIQMTFETQLPNPYQAFVQIGSGRTDSPAVYKSELKNDTQLQAWLLSESYKPAGILTYTDGLLNSPINIVWPDETTGVLDFSRNLDKMIIKLAASHNIFKRKLTIVLTRDAEGNVLTEVLTFSNIN